ncbi:uncharacterized protein TNIN_12871 [Trichonephila inaurata madagascariensis]|uniref:Uncharacterized protein n=1 Tax=Trichonephila inaurata madagascariensis TaxID=2747483 RepID=A0A8X7CPA6_9ARAC|nr:uncharacterized protein TNIN_12871 [Trichonephila inaurata madagascariensis]
MEFRQQHTPYPPSCSRKGWRNWRKSYLSENKWTAIRMQKDTLFSPGFEYFIAIIEADEWTINEWAKRKNWGHRSSIDLLKKPLFFCTFSVYHFTIVFEEGGPKEKIELCLVFYKRLDLVLIGFLCKRSNG